MEKVPVYYLGHVIKVLEQKSFPIDNWLLDRGITKENLYSSDAPINREQFDHLLQSIMSHQDLEHLGLTIGSKLQIAHHGTFGLAILNCESISHIIQFVQNYLIIRIPFIEINTIESKDELIVLAKDTHWSGKEHRFVIEAVSGAMFNIFKALQQKLPQLQIVRLFFDYTAPSYVEKYTMFMPSEVTFEHAYCGISIKKNMLDLQIPDVDKLSFIQAKQACQQELEKSLQLTNYRGKVLQLLMRYNCKRPTLEEIAKTLRLSPRTLHRYLQAEGTSFKQIIEQHQASLAKEYLISYAYSVTQTAATLGFVDVANFRRAFKRWYQMTPTQFIMKYR